MDSQIAQWIILGIGVAFIAIERAVKLYKTVTGNNPHPCNKHADELKEHGKKLVRLETKVDEIEEDIKEIKGKL